MYVAFTRMPDERYRRRHRSLMLCLRDVSRSLFNSLVCWFFSSQAKCFVCLELVVLKKNVIRTKALATDDDDVELQGQTVTNAEAWFNIALRPQKP